MEGYPESKTLFSYGVASFWNPEMLSAYFQGHILQIDRVFFQNFPV